MFYSLRQSDVCDLDRAQDSEVRHGANAVKKFLSVKSPESRRQDVVVCVASQADHKHAHTRQLTDVSLGDILCVCSSLLRHPCSVPFGFARARAKLSRTRRTKLQIDYKCNRLGRVGRVDGGKKNQLWYVKRIRRKCLELKATRVDGTVVQLVQIRTEQQNKCNRLHQYNRYDKNAFFIVVLIIWRVRRTAIREHPQIRGFQPLCE